MRALFCFGVSVALTTGACGGKAASPTTVPVTAAVADAGDESPVPSAADSATKTPPATSAKVTPGIAAGTSCVPASCVFHAGVAGYFNCLAGAAGACTHFGGSCTPADRCMFDPAAKSYKNCNNPSDGTCDTFGAACNPKPGCWFDPNDGLFRTCATSVGGTCSKWGELCSPAATPS